MRRQGRSYERLTQPSSFGNGLKTQHLHVSSISEIVHARNPHQI